MASLFQKDDSPFWQLRYRDEAGKWRKRTTRFRVGTGTETAEARRECASQTLKERSASQIRHCAGWLRAWKGSCSAMETGRSTTACSSSVHISPSFLPLLAALIFKAWCKLAGTITGFIFSVSVGMGFHFFLFLILLNKNSQFNFLNIFIKHAFLREMRTNPLGPNTRNLTRSAVVVRAPTPPAPGTSPCSPSAQDTTSVSSYRHGGSGSRPHPG